METIGHVARRFGLSRSTLLYYERIGILVPSGRSEGGYRLYSEEDVRRLERICAFREAGLPIEAVRRVLENAPDGAADALERHLIALNAEARIVRQRQSLVCALLGAAPLNGRMPLDYGKWAEIFDGAGFSPEMRQAWHTEFERRFPDAHHEFLLALGLREQDAVLRRKGGLSMDANDKIVQIFFEAFSGLARLGPGDENSTREALSRLAPLPPHPDILDVGCGTGAGALLLAEATGGHVTALDNHEPLLAETTRRAAERGLAGRISAVPGTMFDLPFADGSFDLIWSEGSIYILGFERGVREWKRLLRPGGAFAASDMVLLAEELPEEARVFWEAEGLTLFPVQTFLDVFRREGYEDVRHFVLPREAWYENYYLPLETNIGRLRAKYAEDAEALALLERLQAEVDLFRKWGHTYGYVFFTARLSR